MTAGVWQSDLKQWFEQRSTALGFDLAGIAAADEPNSAAEARDATRFEAWVDAGRAGDMEYLKRRDEEGRLLRSAVQVAHPWANSVAICAMSYGKPEPLSIDQAPSTSGWIARYAWSGQPLDPESPTRQLRPTDYHDFLLTRLLQLAHELGERAGGESKCYVDTGPLVERSLAARAGIGWIGKNTCVLNEGKGSWLLLGVILSSLRLPAEMTVLAADRCGSCTRCIDACPTEALTAPHQMDASRCIAYLTIEKKGSIAAELRESIGRQVFGCDICQDVCPWNQRSSNGRSNAGAASPIQTRHELINPELDWLASMDAGTFRQWFKGSPIERTRRARLHRNVAIAMGNSGEQRFLAQLQAWCAEPDLVLAEAASWAIDKLQANEGSSAAQTAGTVPVYEGAALDGYAPR